MTREERAIQILEQRQCCRECVVENCTCTECDEAFEMAFKALKQEPVLGKIRAEIETHCGLAMENHCRYCSRCTNLMGVREILEIIDKHRAGSEE